MCARKHLNARISWSSTWEFMPRREMCVGAPGKAVAAPKPLCSPSRATSSRSMRRSAHLCVSTLAVARHWPWSRASAGRLLCMTLTRRKWSSKWDHLLKNGVWPLGSVGTPLLKGHRARVCLCPEMGSCWTALRARCPLPWWRWPQLHTRLLCLKDRRPASSVIFSQKHVFIKITGAEHWEKKKSRVAILISDKIDFKIKTITRDKKGNYIMIKG